MSADNTTATFAGNGFSGIYVWGCQVEAGAFATSYIPTVASQVTRSADSASMTGTNFSSWYRTDEGTIYSEFLRESTSGATRGVWSINSGVTNNSMDYRPNSSNYTVQINGVSQADMYPGGGSANVSTKSAFVYKTNDFAATTNAGTIQTDTAGFIPSVTQLQIGALSVVAGQVFGGTIKKLAYYPKRLTNAELQGLTTV